MWMANAGNLLKTWSEVHRWEYWFIHLRILLGRSWQKQKDVGWYARKIKRETRGLYKAARRRWNYLGVLDGILCGQEMCKKWDYPTLDIHWRRGMVENEYILIRGIYRWLDAEAAVMGMSRWLVIQNIQTMLKATGLDRLLRWLSKEYSKCNIN